MVMASITSFLVNYFRLVKRTTRFVPDRPAIQEWLDEHAPFIGVGWHGQLWFLGALGKHYQGRCDIVISRHVTAEIIARVVERFGLGTIRGSASIDPKRAHDRRGLTVFREMMRSLKAGRSIVTSGDFEKRTRREVTGGLIRLAKKTGRPIVPLAIATSRSFTIHSAWDKSTVNLPFSQGSVVFGDPIIIPPDIGQDDEEDLRREVGRRIDDANRKAAEIASRK